MNAKHKDTEKHDCKCPYCDHEIEKSCFPFCQGCGVTVSFCPKCEKPISQDAVICPSCGAQIKKQHLS